MKTKIEHRKLNSKHMLNFITDLIRFRANHNLIKIDKILCNDEGSIMVIMKKCSKKRELGFLKVLSDIESKVLKEYNILIDILLINGIRDLDAQALRLDYPVEIESGLSFGGS